MDYKLVSAVLVMLCLVLGAFAFSGAGGKVVYVNNTVYPTDDLRVSYLFPARCLNCDLNVPGQCDYCNSYYGEGMMDAVSQDVGTPVKFYVSDAVIRPGSLVAYKKSMVLGDGRSKTNLANIICQVAGVKKSCDLYKAEMGRVRACVGKYGVGVNTIVYHTSGKQCTGCGKTDPIVGQLVKMDYNETTKFRVHTVDRSDSQQARFISDCVQGFDSNEYAPQLICPATGKDLTGQFSLSQAQQFTEQCMDAK